MIWAGTASAANVYYSVGQNATDHKTGSPTVTIDASGVATFSVAQTAANMGVGDRVTYGGAIAYISAKQSTTVWNLVTATGGTPAATTSASVASIAHEYTSLSAAEAGASDASHMATTTLIGGNFILNFPCYYDTGNDLTSATIDGYTTGASNWIRVYTAISTDSEVNETQRHSGVWNNKKYTLGITTTRSIADLYVQDDFVRIDGIQFEHVYDYTSAAIKQVAIQLTVAGSKMYVTNNIFRNKNNSTGSLQGLYIGDSDTVTYVYNNVFYGYNNADGMAIQMGGAGPAGVYVYNNTFSSSTIGAWAGTAGTKILKNNLFVNIKSPATGTFAAGTDYNSTASSSMGYAVTGGGNTHDRLSQTFTFIGESAANFHLRLGDSAARGYGANLKNDANLAFSTDIDGENRSETGAWDIGADEVVRTTQINSPKNYYTSGLVGYWGFNGQDTNWTSATAGNTTCRNSARRNTSS